MRPSRLSESPPIDRVFRATCGMNASDLHLCVGNPPMIRKDGRMQALDPAATALGVPEVERLLEPIIPDKNRRDVSHPADTDFAYQIVSLAPSRAQHLRHRHA